MTNMNLPALNGNWVDLLILAVLAYFVSEAIRVGFWVIVADFLSFLLSLVIALRAYQWAASFLRNNFSLGHSVSNAVGFLAVAVVAEIGVNYLLEIVIRKIPYKLWKGKWSKFAAVLPALGEGLVLTSFVLTLIIGLPLSPQLKSDVSNSKIGGYLVERTTGLESRLNEVFGGVIEDSLTYLTVKPDSHEAIPLSIETGELVVDEKAESAMFALVNAERRRVGVAELTWRAEVVPVARAHARDMWERQYFGHVSPDGENVGDRLQNAGVGYHLAGENLALAPTLATAHNGLMNSEGHRANILDPDFRQLGIGVVDNGVYGKMFVQIFTD